MKPLPYRPPVVPVWVDSTPESPPTPTRELPTELGGECHDLEYTLVAVHQGCATDFELVPLVCSCRNSMLHA